MISIYALSVILVLVICVWLTAKKQFASVALVIIISGFFQEIILSAFPIWEFQLIDDAAIFAMGATIFAKSLFVRQERFDSSNKFLILVVLVVIVELLKSPMGLSSFSQARQILFPALLVYSGWKISRNINLKIVFIALISLGCFSAFWSISELLLQRPLIDPITANSIQAMADSAKLRNGIPSNYFADGIIPGEAWFRPGGPFLNPPTLGFFMGTVALAAMTLKKSWVRNSVIILTLAVLTTTVARAGLLIAGLTIFGTWLWFKVGPRITMLLLAGLCLIAALISSSQGGTAAHATGIPELLWIGITHPLGLGFDVIGYQASNPAGSYDVGESFVGLITAWLGWPAIIGLVILVVFYIRKFSDRPISKFAVTLLFWGAGFSLAALFSESASGLSATAICWILLGYIISGEGTRYIYPQIEVSKAKNQTLSDVSCVVIHHNNFPDVIVTVHKLIENDLHPKNIVLVDNSENALQLEKLKRLLPEDVSIVESLNRGYAAAANLGIRWLRENNKLHDFVLVSTHETSPNRDAIRIMRDYLYSYNRLGVVGPLLIDSGKPEPTIWSRGGELSSFFSSPIHKGFGEKFLEDEFVEVESCKWVDGSFCLYKSVIFDVMELNENYFLYFEETEFHTKLIRDNWEVACVQEAQVFQSSNGVPDFYFARNTYLFQNFLSNRFLARRKADLIIGRKMIINILKTRKTSSTTKIKAGRTQALLDLKIKRENVSSS